VNIRARLLDAGDLLEEALDKYSFAREIHLQRRRSLVARDPSEKKRLTYLKLGSKLAHASRSQIK
jgi:ABC-type transporter lipoprotein component MlaA